MVTCIQMLGGHVFPISRSERITSATYDEMSHEHELPDSPFLANRSYKGIPRYVDSGTQPPNPAKTRIRVHH